MYAPNTPVVARCTFQQEGVVVNHGATGVITGETWTQQTTTGAFGVTTESTSGVVTVCWRVGKPRLKDLHTTHPIGRDGFQMSSQVQVRDTWREVKWSDGRK